MGSVRSVVTTAALVVLVAGCGSAASRATSAAPSTSGPSGPGVSFGNGSVVPTTIVSSKPLPSGKIAHAIEVAEAIRAAGIGCTHADLETGPFNGTPGNPSVDQVSCEIGDDIVAISLWADHAALVRSASFIRSGVCFSAAHEKVNLTYVNGDNWIVFPQRAATARRLSTGLHAPLVTLHC